MVRQEQSVIRTVIGYGLIALWLVACSPRRQPYEAAVSIPEIYVSGIKESLKVKEGIIYYHEQPFSGWHYELYSTGDTAMLIPFYKGKEQGVARQWHANRKLSEVRSYKNGRKTGEHKGWWENGNQRFVYHFEKDLLEGDQKEWNESGFLYKSSNYKAGKESGLQQMWRSDGKLVANYVVKDGRNYGLTGVKNCKSVWEDETKN